MVLHEPQPAQAQQPRPAVSGGAVALQCVASMAGTLLGEALGSTLPAKLVAGCLGALIGAFLTAPGRHRRRRIVAVAILLALLHALRRAGDALASERRAWLPASWAMVGVAAVIGFAGGSVVTTVRGGWDETTAVTVPQVRGEARAAALTELADAGLSATTSTEPSEAIEAGLATRTDPPAGATVEDDVTVALYLSTGSPPATVTIPEVAGLERATARALLRDHALRPHVQSEPSSTIASGSATRTLPPAGTDVDRDARVTLFVSAGPATSRLEVPAVVGMTREAAEQTVTGAGLEAAFAEEPSPSVAAGVVVRSDPAAGTVVDRGATVTLVVSSGPPPLVVPPVVGKPEGDARGLLKAAGLGASSTTVDSTQPLDTVVRSDPAPGAEVERGSTVRLFVSCGSDPCPVD